MAQADDIFSAIDKALAGPSRTSLSRWMRLHYAELAKRLDGQRADWTALAAVFAAHSLTDRSGKPPSAQIARKAWERVRRSAQKAKPSSQPPLSATRATLPAPVAAVVSPGSEAVHTLSASTTSRRRSFQISTPKKDT